MGKHQAPAAGWITVLDWWPGGLWAKVDWTGKARVFLAARQYRYHPPVFLFRPGDRKVRSLHSVALTNSPRMLNLRALVAKTDVPGPTLSASQAEINRRLGITHEVWNKYAS